MKNNNNLNVTKKIQNVEGLKILNEYCLNNLIKTKINIKNKHLNLINPSAYQ